MLPRRTRPYILDEVRSGCWAMQTTRELPHDNNKNQTSKRRIPSLVVATAAAATLERQERKKKNKKGSPRSLLGDASRFPASWSHRFCCKIGRRGACSLLVGCKKNHRGQACPDSHPIFTSSRAITTPPPPQGLAQPPATSTHSARQDPSLPSTSTMSVSHRHRHPTPFSLTSSHFSQY